MPEENTFKIKSLKKLGIKKEPLVDAQGEVVQPGSRILKGYWGEWIVFGSKVPGYTLKLKIRMTPSGSKIRLINPLMTPDNNWENRKTSVHIDWGDGRYDKIYKKKINSGRFNRTSSYTLEHNYTAEVGDEMWLSITSIEPLVPYGCEIVEMLGQFPYDRYDLNMDRDGHYCGLFGVDQYVEDYPELNKLYGAGRTITKVSSELLDNWRDTKNMDRMFEGWGLIEVPNGFFKWETKFHPDTPDNTPQWQSNNMIVDTCESYYRTFADCPNLTTVWDQLLGSSVHVFRTTKEMFSNCPKLTNTLSVSNAPALEVTEKMYYKCSSLVVVHEDFLAAAKSDDYEGMAKLINTDSMFEDCISLTTISWDRFMRYAPKVQTARYMFRNTPITHAGFIMGDKVNLRDITGIYMNCRKLKTVRSNAISTTTGSFNDNSIEDKDKLKIAHMFDGAGDPETGMEFPIHFFAACSRSSNVGTFSALASDCTYVFHNAVLKNIPSEAPADGSWYNEWLFVRVFEKHQYGKIEYDISHIMDGVTIKHKWVPAPDFFANNAIKKADYALANSKWDEVSNDLFFTGTRGSWNTLKSVKGLFAGCTINCKFPETVFGRVSIENQTSIEDFSEFFKDATYGWPNIPIDYIVSTSASFCDMSRMFKGSNITTYRPIHWRSSDRCTYDFTDFSDNTFSAPKEWILDGYTDRSNWEPSISPNPLILWVNVDSVNKTMTLSGDVTTSIDWGDGSTDKGLIDGNMTHTYAEAGDYKISIISTKSHQPTKDTMKRVFRVDGEIPYDTELNLSQDLPDVEWADTDRFMINYVGPRVAAVCKHVALSCQGYISPYLLKYGSNSGYKEGLKFIDIIDPMNPTITFGADFVIVDKTITMDIDFTLIPLQVGETTHIELTIGQVRVDNDLLHVDFTNCTPRNIPLRFWSNCIGHKFNKFHGVKMLDVGYLRPEHFEYRYGSKLHPDIKDEDVNRGSGTNIISLNTSNKRIIDGRDRTTESLYTMPQLVQPKRIDSFMCCNPVYRFHHSLSIDSINSINSNSVTSHAMTTREYSEMRRAIPYQGIHDDHYLNFEDEFMTFVLENVDNKEPIEIYDLYKDESPYYQREYKKTTIEVIDPNGELDEVIEMDGKLGTIGPYKADKLIIRIKARFPVWLGDGLGSDDIRNRIVAVYGIINDLDRSEMILKHRFGVTKNEGSYYYNPLGRNIRYVGESILWGVSNTEMDDMFRDTNLEIIPPNLFAYSEARSFKNCFMNTKIKRIPDFLWCNDTTLTYDDTNKLDISNAFNGCDQVEYVYEPIDPEIRASIHIDKALNKCKTYACKSSTNIERDIFKHHHLINPVYYHSNLDKMPVNTSVPELTHDELIAINRESSPEATLVSLNSTVAINPTNIADKWYCMDYVMWIDVPKTDFNSTNVSSYNYTESQYNSVFKYLHGLRGIRIYENNLFGLVQVATNVHPDHFMLINNENLLYMSNVLAGVQFNYTPNVFFINQWRMIDATGLLLRSRFDKIPEAYIAPPTHLSDYLGRPIYIGGATDAFRYHPRPLDKMLRYRNNYLVLKYFMNNITEGDLTCPTFTNHRVINAHHAFHATTTMVTDETFIDIDRESNVYKYYPDNITTKGIFWRNTSINTDCRVFHIWKEVWNDNSSYEFQETTQLLHPPKDMFDALTRLTKLEETFKGSNIRDLPNCNPRIREYPYFAANSKVSLIPEYWFKYTGTDTLDIRYAFDDCRGLIITDKLIDPAVTVPVLKYSSLRNAWSIIGDDPEIFEGVNTKFDGTDKSLVRVIPEEDLFRQTLDIHDERWTLSVKALGMETIGNEPVQDDNLFMVSWGDGSSPSVVSYRNMEWEDYSHKYDAKGRYQVMILSTQWCCYVNSPQDLSSKYTTYSIDGMLQNSTCREVCDTGLTNMFGFTVEKVFPTMFDKLSDVTTVKDLPSLFYNFKKLKEIPEQILWKMTALESIYRFAMYTPITTLPAKLLSKNAKLKNANSIAERCYSLTTIPEGLFDGNPLLETIQRGFCDINTLTEAPRNLLAKNPNLLNIGNMFSNCDNMVMDNTYDDFLAKQTKLVDAYCLFRNWIIRQLPPNLLNRCTSLQSTEGMFALEDFSSVGWDSIDDARWKWYNDMSNRDATFEIPSNWLPKSVVDASGMFFFRTKLTAYPSDLFTGNAVLEDANHMFMNTAIRRIHSETFKTMSHSHILNLERWIYKDKRFGKSFYIHYCPKVVSSAINVPTVRTESMLLGTYGTMTEAQLFSGVTTDPSNIHSLYVQEFEPAKFKLKMTGDGTFITFKPITKSDVTFTDLTMVQWGDGTEDLWEEPIAKADIQKVIKHNYKTPGEYTISVGAKYCLVPIVDDLPEAYQVESVVFPEDIDQVKQVSIGGEYGVGDLKINKDMIYATKQNAEVEISLVPRPYYVGETYTVDVTVEPKGIEVGEQTTVELNIVRDTSDPFERLEISGTLGPMEGYTEFPRVAEMPELQYRKWSGTETFFSRNTQITSFDRSFMNLNYEFRIADKVFWSLTGLTSIGGIFWNTKLVIEPGWAPDFNKNTKLAFAWSAFRSGNSSDYGIGPNGSNDPDPYIPNGTELHKNIWRVNKDQYQPFSSLSSLVNMANIHLLSDITYVMMTNLSSLDSLHQGYYRSKVSWLPADFFRTLNTRSNIDCAQAFRDTRLTSIAAASDGKTLLDFTIGANQTLDFHEMFIGTNININDVINMLNNSAFIKTTVVGTNLNIEGIFGWCPSLQSKDASALKLAIPSRTGTLNMSHMFSRDLNASETDIDRNITMLYNIKPGAITIAASGSPNVIVNNMFDHCYADATISDAHECFVVTGDDANFSKAKALADKSTLNTLTVMTTTVVPK